MLYITYQNMQYAVNLKLLKKALRRLLFKTVLVLLVVVPLLTMYVDFCRFPEKYISLLGNINCITKSKAEIKNQSTITTGYM